MAEDFDGLGPLGKKRYDAVNAVVCAIPEVGTSVKTPLIEASFAWNTKSGRRLYTNSRGLLNAWVGSWVVRPGLVLTITCGLNYGHVFHAEINHQQRGISVGWLGSHCNRLPETNFDRPEHLAKWLPHVLAHGTAKTKPVNDLYAELWPELSAKYEREERFRPFDRARFSYRGVEFYSQVSSQRLNVLFVPYEQGDISIGLAPAKKYTRSELKRLRNKLAGSLLALKKELDRVSKT